MRLAACCRPPFYYDTHLETHLNMNKKTILTLIALTVLLTVEAQQHRTVQFFAHRGSRLEYDENTMPAFRATYDKGIRGYETDIRMTADGRLVVSHDSSLKRLTPCDGEVEKMTAKQIRAVKTKQGNDILFLEELCRWLADKEGMYVEFEMKTSSPAYDEQQLERYCDLLYTTAMKHKPANSTYLFTSSDKRALRTMQRLHPDADLLLIIGRPISDDTIREALDMGIKRLGCTMGGTSRDAVAKAKKAGLFVSLWPGQSIDDFILGVALGADALCCDRAVEVKEFFDEHMPWVEAR